MAITGEHVCVFKYVDYEIGNPPTTIADFLYKRIEDVESKHVADYRNRTKIFLNILI